MNKPKFFKKTALFLAVVLLLTSVMAVLPAFAETGATEIVTENGIVTNVVWHYGFVGSSVNAYGHTNKIVNNSGGKASSYRYSDILTVPHAGTSISFTDKAFYDSKNNLVGAVSINAYIISSWKQENGSWVIDLDGTNIAGVGVKSSSIAVYNSSKKEVTYTYTTQKDNEHIRLGCYGTPGSEVCPTVYVGDSAVGSDGTLANTLWFSGYIGSSVHGTVSNRDTIVQGGTGYSYSAPILLKKAGTKISFRVTIGGTSITKAASGNAYVFSVWQRDPDNSFRLGYGCPGDDQDHNTAWQTVNGKTYEYFYTSSYDNEYVRLSYYSGAANNKLPETFPTITITENGGGDATLAKAYYDPEYILFTRSVIWNAGYVGSAANGENSVNTIKDGGTAYKYTNIIPVFGKGSLVMFTDAGGFASAGAYVFSSFTSENNALTTVDTEGANLDGGNSACYVNNPDGSRTYYYYTTKNVEYLRLSIRSDGANQGTVNKGSTSFIAPAVYVISSATLNTAPGTVSGTFLPQLTSTLGTYSSLFAGKEMTIIGDSYFAGNGIDKTFVWPKLLADLYGMTFYNQGINGSAISDSSGNTAKYNPMVNRWNQMQGSENTALVLFEGGRNDYNQQTPIGTLGDTTTKTFYGAIDTVIKGLLQKFPNALIVCLNPWQLEGYPNYNKANSAGHTSNDYAEAFCNYVASLDNDRVKMLNTNSTDVVPVYIQDASFRLTYAQTPTDGSHMNIKGMNYMLPYFEKRLAEFMTDYTAMQNAGGGIVFSENGKPMRVMSTAKDTDITVKAPMLQSNDALIGWSGTVGGKDVLLPVGGTLNVKAGESGTLTPKYLHMSSAGNTVRLVSGSEGIRFLTEVNLAEYDALAAIPGVTLTRGTLIVPKFYLDALGNELTLASIAANSKKHLNVVAGAWYDQGTDSALFAGSIANIYENHYTLEYIATGYITVCYSDGTSVTFYADKTPKNGVTIYGLAGAALSDISATRTEFYQYETEGGYSPYTADQRNFLSKYLGDVLTVTESKSADCGFIATSKNVDRSGYTITIDTDRDLMIIRRTDKTALSAKNITGVFFCGSPAEYFEFRDGAVILSYSEYTKLY